MWVRSRVFNENNCGGGSIINSQKGFSIFLLINGTAKLHPPSLGSLLKSLINIYPNPEGLLQVIIVRERDTYKQSYSRNGVMLFISYFVVWWIMFLVISRWWKAFSILSFRVISSCPCIRGFTRTKVVLVNWKSVIPPISAKEEISSKETDLWHILSRRKACWRNY